MLAAFKASIWAWAVDVRSSWRLKNVGLRSAHAMRPLQKRRPKKLPTKAGLKFWVSELMSAVLKKLTACLRMSNILWGIRKFW